MELDALRLLRTMYYAWKEGFIEIEGDFLTGRCYPKDGVLGL